MTSGDTPPQSLQERRLQERRPRDRRRFLAGAIAAVQAAIGCTLAVILGGSILSPSAARRRENLLPAAALVDLPENEPTAVTIRIARDDGYAQIVERQVVFLVRSGNGSVSALSSECTHLGCRVSWNGESQALECPCHGGVFDRSGTVTGGPPPAPLAKLEARVDGDRVLVRI